MLQGEDDPHNPTFREIPIKFSKRQDKLWVSSVQCHLAHIHHSAAQGKQNKGPQREGGFLLKEARKD